MKHGKHTLVAYGSITVLATAWAVAVYRLVGLHAVPGWDEASNMLWGYAVLNGLRNADIPDLIRQSYAQVYYPPLHSWFIGVSSLLTGFYVERIRFAHLLYAVAVPLLMVLVGSRGARGYYVGLSAAVFFFMSPMSILFAGLALKEMQGAALTLLAVWAFGILRGRNRVGDAVRAALTVLILFHTKYNYALLLLTGFAAFPAVRVPGESRPITKPHLVFWLAVAAGIGAWILLQGDRLITEYWLKQLPQTRDIGTIWEKALFYVRSLVYVYAPNSVVGFVLAGSIILCAAYIRKDKFIRDLWIVTAVTFAAMTLYAENLHDRYVFTVFPLVCLLAATALDRAVRAFTVRRPAGRALAVAVIGIPVILGIPVITEYPDRIYAVAAHTLRSPVFNQADYRDAVFGTDPDRWPSAVPGPESEDLGDVIAYVFGNIRPFGRFSVVGNLNELSRKHWLVYLAAEAERRRLPAPLPDVPYAVTVEVLPGSRYYTRDFALFNAKDIPSVLRMAKNPRFSLLDERIFSDIGIRVRIYGDQSPAEKFPY